MAGEADSQASTLAPGVAAPITSWRNSSAQAIAGKAGWPGGQPMPATCRRLSEALRTYELKLAAQQQLIDGLEPLVRQHDTTLLANRLAEYSRLPEKGANLLEKAAGKPVARPRLSSQVSLLGPNAHRPAAAQSD